MPLTQQPSFEAVKTLDVRPSTRAGNSKTTSYIPRRVLYTEPMSPLRASGVACAVARCLLTARCPVGRWLRALNGRGARSRRPRDLPNLLSLACLNQL